MAVVFRVIVSLVTLLIASVVALLAVQIAFGASRPGFVPIATLLIMAPILLVIWRRKPNRHLLAEAHETARFAAPRPSTIHKTPGAVQTDWSTTAHPKRAIEVAAVRDRVLNAHILDAYGYRCEQWVVGEQVTEEVYHRLKDGKGDLHVSVAFKEGEPHATVVKRESWLELKKLVDDVANPSGHEQRPVVECPDCGQKLRLPAGGRGKVVCPSCKSRLTADAIGETVTLESSTPSPSKDVSFEDTDNDSSTLQARAVPPSWHHRKAITYRILWAVTLLAGALLWADILHVALDPSFAHSLPITSRFVVAVGLSGPLVAASGITAAIVWAITKKPNTAMSTWTNNPLGGVCIDEHRRGTDSIASS